MKQDSTDCQVRRKRTCDTICTHVNDMSILQMTQVNLNSMLCPAISDPFHGPHYRIFAFVHQSFYVILHGKLYTLVVRVLLALTATLGLTAPRPLPVGMEGANGMVGHPARRESVGSRMADGTNGMVRRPSRDSAGINGSVVHDHVE